MTVAAQENTRKGELIYEHYQAIQSLLHDAKSRKLSLSELKKKYKILKNVDEKTQTITIEI